MQLEGLFDVEPSKIQRQKWEVDLPLDEKDWSIGLIVGPSGAGKTTVAREVFGEAIVDGFDWPETASLIDAFPEGLGIKDITGYLSSVGFSSPPSWMRPFSTLSNGEQFRATLARALAEKNNMVVMDEFTSVVDRTVARIGSAAVAKAVRKSGKKFVAVSCHYDVADWLQPDWVYEPTTNTFSWRCLQRRPAINIEVRRVHRSAWKLFAHHHYLSHNLSKAAKCFVGFVDGEPAVFTGVISFPHPKSPGWREHRTVCLPDFQGVGIGNAMSEFVAGLFRATGKPYTSTTGNPAMIYYRAKSKRWKMIRKPSRHARGSSSMKQTLRKTQAWNRNTASFRYLGEPLVKEAKEFGVLPGAQIRS